jgi:hypothetical protein
MMIKELLIANPAVRALLSIPRIGNYRRTYEIGFKIYDWMLITIHSLGLEIEENGEGKDR